MILSHPVQTQIKVEFYAVGIIQLVKSCKDS